MKPVFVDTSALIALGNERDLFYRRASECRRELVRARRTFLTTDLVLAELCNAFSAVRFRPIAVSTVESIQSSVMWNCIASESKLMKQGFSLYKQMGDKSWDLVDCISILVAGKYGCNDIFTSDHHFEQAGFRILLDSHDKKQGF